MATEAVLLPMSEARYADYLKAKGQTIVEHQGRFWKSYPPGFYHPVHLKADLGFDVHYIPSRVWFAPLCAGIVRQRRPHAYYRLCGHD